MIILPSMEETFQSGMTPEEICGALRAVTVSRKERYGAGRRAEFVGEVGDSGFKVIKELDKPFYRDSFLPVITGSIRTEGDRSVVTIKMRMLLFACIFSAIWLGGIAFFLLMGILAALVDRTPELLCAAALMMLFGQVIIRAGFYIPAKKAMKRMEELFGKV